MHTSGGNPDSHYDDLIGVAELVEAGEHRALIGGMWDEIGRLQINFLVENGLSPDHHLLDIGCGSLRGGVHFTAYLQPHHYWGMDINETLLTAGYDREIVPGGLDEKLDRSNLIADGEFNFERFGQRFDAAIAQSLFTHINTNRIRLCLQRLSQVMDPGGRLFATFFIVPENSKADQPFHHPKGIVSFAYKDPFHYRISEIDAVINDMPWQIAWIGDWNHPRDQTMVVFELTDASTDDDTPKSLTD